MVVPDWCHLEQALNLLKQVQHGVEHIQWESCKDFAEKPGQRGRRFLETFTAGQAASLQAALGNRENECISRGSILLQLASMYFPKLKKLILPKAYSYRGTFEEYSALASACPLLEESNLVVPFNHQALFGTSWKVLNFVGHFLDTGRGNTFHSTKLLRHVSQECKNVDTLRGELLTPDNLKKVIKAFPGIKNLDLSNDSIRFLGQHFRDKNHIFDDDTVKELFEVFKGPLERLHLKLFHCPQLTDMGLYIIADHASHLRYLRLDGLCDAEDGLKCLISKATNLEEVHIGNSWRMVTITGSILQRLGTKCQKLKKLTLVNIPMGPVSSEPNVGASFKKLTHLELIRSTIPDGFVQSLPALTHLKLDETTHVPPDCVMDLILESDTIESINIWIYRLDEVLDKGSIEDRVANTRITRDRPSKLSSLKVNQNLGSNIIRVLANCCPNLNYLNLPETSKINPEDLIALVSNCGYLTTLKLPKVREVNGDFTSFLVHCVPKMKCLNIAGVEKGLRMTCVQRLLTELPLLTELRVGSTEYLRPVVERWKVGT